ncbi:MAG: ribosome small subunit-dependent GTPase A [Ardenticatenales bacterium]
MSEAGAPPERRKTADVEADGAIVDGWVVRTQSGFYAVETDAGPVTATLRGRLKRTRDRNDLVALGDRVRVIVSAAPSGGDGGMRAVIVERLERATSLTRRAPGPKGVWSKDVVVANIDQLLITFSCHRPEPNLRLIDRFLALAEIDELDSVIVMNKAELGLTPEVTAALADYRRIGYTTLIVSAREGDGLDAVRQALEGRVSAVVGPSGVGKSSLLNAIEPGLALQVGAVSEAHHKGRHTTRVGELHLLSCGGRVADTPGLRELAFWEVDSAELQWGFVEFIPHLNQCRFDDCTHVHEPGCAVQAAVAAGEISPRRYDSYVRLLAGDVDRA